MRKLLIVLVPVLLIAALAGGGIWLSQQEEPETEPGTLVEQAADGLLVGRSTDVRVPWGRLQVTITDPLDSVDTDAGTVRGPLVGVQVELRATDDTVPVDRIPDASLEDPVFAVTADGEDWELPALTGWVDGVAISPGARRQYVAVPRGAEDVEVTVTYDGVTQTIDAATADVSTGAAAPLYDASFARPGAPCGDQLWSTGAAAVEGVGSACFVRSSVTHPYVAGLGWAPEGSQWLVVTVIPGSPQAFETEQGTYEAQAPDVETSYGLGFTEPVEVYAANDVLPDGVEPDAFDPQVVVFEVPVDRETGQMDIRTRLTGTLEGRGKPRTAEALVVQGAFV